MRQSIIVPRLPPGSIPALLLMTASAIAACLASPAGAATGEEVQARISTDVARGRPVIVHVTVALCDNDHQGIVPVPVSLGNGQDPATNLYWGARYGIGTFFWHEAGWTRIAVRRPDDPRILERSVFFRLLPRAGRNVPTYLVADAWDGAQMAPAIERFWMFAGGAVEDTVRLLSAGARTVLAAGGASQVIAFVGHNGLMDAPSGPLPVISGHAGARSGIVLACLSKSYFTDVLHGLGAHPLLLTTGLMAPEAYTLDAAIRAWVGGGTPAATRDAAAAAYRRYQGCSVAAALRLFWSESP